MISTFYSLGTLDSTNARFFALLIGLFFGLALERAGFGSSRKLTGLFYFKDMAVLKVMFTALITAMLGMSFFIGLGGINPATEIYYMSTYYGTYIAAGLLFGIGFVMGGWCPGTAAVGLASGKQDALIFLVGVGVGSILFNELFPFIKPLYTWGQSSRETYGQAGLAFIYDSLKMSKASFGLLFTLLAIFCFWGCEYIEKKKGSASSDRGKYFNSPFLKAFSIALIVFGAGLFLFRAQEAETASGLSTHPFSEKDLLTSIASAEDHIDPEYLADRLSSDDKNIIVIDVRSGEEFNTFHIRGALNVQLPSLPEFLQKQSAKKMIVLYSNGMTHPAQARDILYRIGFENVYILTDGLTGFIERCLKPISLRSEPVSAEKASQIHMWRRYFYGRDEEPTSTVQIPLKLPIELPGLIDTAWLAENLENRNLKIIDSRNQPEYNRGHIPGSLSISPEHFRGIVDGIPSMLLPQKLLAEKLSLSGIRPENMIILIYGGDRVRDATLIGMIFERLGHKNYSVLEGGFDKWAAEGKPMDTILPDVTTAAYPVGSQPDAFTLNYQQVLDHVRKKSALILDVRPREYYRGEKSDEARAGHIPGALNRPYTEDLSRFENYTALKPASELAVSYAALIPEKDTSVIVHCRTGHQASQTFFVLKNLLGYKNVFWYDAGWTEWAARPELPIETSN